MNQLRILVWSHKLPPPWDDGTALYVHHLCEGLGARGHVLRALTLQSEESQREDESKPYGVIRYRRPPRLSSVVHGLQAARHVLDFRPDVVILGHVMSKGVTTLQLLCSLKKVRLVVVAHGADLTYSVWSTLDAKARDRLLERADLLIANSSYTAQRLCRAGVESHRIRIVNPGVDIDRFRALPRADARARFDLGDGRICLSVSRLVARKGHETVLAALEQVVTEVEDVRYVIAGRGEEEEALRRLSARLGLEKYVRFLGFVESEALPALYSACDVMVLPCVSTDEDVEGFGIVFAEAAACSRPTIGGLGGGVSDAILDGVTGYLVAPGDPAAVAGALVELLSNEELASRMGREGRRRVEAELTWGRAVDKVDEALEELD